MRILLLNWRDIKHPRHGGAEILTHEIAKGWVKKGHQVIFFSSRFKNCKKQEMIDGVRIIRKGFPDGRYLFWSVHFQAFFNYFIKFRGKVDVVVDEIHGLPFFTPLYVKEKKVALICEVADKIWIRMFGVFFGYIGKMVENFYLKAVYKDIFFMTISNSTREELLEKGIKKEDISVLPMGISFPRKISIKPKEKKPTIIFVGRLSPAKGVEDAIKAIGVLKKEIKNINLWIVGKGRENYENYIKEIVSKSNLQDRVKFFGFVTEEEKFQLLSRAHVIVSPSMKEGWGLTVPEAGLVGTPSVGYDVQGLREVIVNGRTGYLTKKNNYKNLSFFISKILKDKNKYKKMANEAKILSKTYNWSITVNQSLKILSA